MRETKAAPTGTIDNCPHCDAYTPPKGLPHLCPKDVRGMDLKYLEQQHVSDISVGDIKAMRSAEDWATEGQKVLINGKYLSRQDHELFIRAIQNDAIAASQKLATDPTEAMWGGLARDIVGFLMMSGPHYGSKLYRHLNALGTEIPEWLREEIPNIDHTPAKGDFAVAIFKAMIEAAPKAPEKI